MRLLSRLYVAMNIVDAVMMINFYKGDEKVTHEQNN